MICAITDEKTSHFHSDALNLQKQEQSFKGIITQKMEQTKNAKNKQTIKCFALLLRNSSFIPLAKPSRD